MTSTTESYTIKLAADGAPTVKMPVQYIDQASEAMNVYRDSYGFGASEMKRGCGEIRDSNNQLVGSIAYNGRVRDAAGKDVFLDELPSRPKRSLSLLAP
jgi:hypothetical protein